MRTWAVLLLAALGVAAAGCSDPEPDAPTGFAAPADPIPGPLPTMEKLEFASTAPPVLPIVEEAEPAATLAVPSGTGEVRLAFDFAADGGGAAILALRVEGAGGAGAAGGAALYEKEVAAPGKLVVVLRDPPAQLGIFAESDARWAVGLVAAFLPADFMPGLGLQVSTPEQTDIEHRFHPERLDAVAGATTRITLFDYDPHAGIRNLQHNIHFPPLGVKSDGKTTWGEVRVLDVPALHPGEYAFECEFHGFTGVLAVA